MVAPADLIIKNGEIYTVSVDIGWAEAIAVKGDKIVYVGSNEGIEEYIDDNTSVIDAKGRLVLPAFIDPHTHLIMSYSKLVWADLSPARSLDDLRKILLNYYRDHPERDYIGGFGWSYEIFREAGLSPHKSILDNIIGDKPIWIVDDTGHIALTNTKFLDLAFEKLTLEELRYGGMEVDERGEPTGVFIDGFNLPLNKVIDFDRDRIDGVLKGIEKALKLGVSTILDALVTFDEINIYKDLHRENKLKIRVNLAFYYHEKTAKDLEKYKALSDELKDEWLRGGTVKLFIDGVIESHTAAMYEPYNDDPSTKGELLFDYDEFIQTVKKIDEMGLQIMTHALGDYGVKVVLDAYEYLRKDDSSKDRRHRIEHVEFIHPNDLERLNKVNPVIVMNPPHASISPNYINYVGDRVNWSFKWRSIAETGVKLAFASDWPVVDLNPIYGIHDAVNRDKYPYGKDEKVCVEKAVKCYTIDAAYALFREKELGSLEVGKKADIIILSQNIFKIDPKKIEDTKVLMTIVNGKIAYVHPDF